jgi:hypothetical protein
LKHARSNGIEKKRRAMYARRILSQVNFRREKKSQIFL